MPELVDIFRERPFQRTQLTVMINEIPWEPLLLGQLGERLFRTVRIPDRTFALGKSDRGAALIPVSAIGAPPVELEGRTASARQFGTQRLAKGSTIRAEDLRSVLNAPMATAVLTAQQEVLNRGEQIRRDFEYTAEWMRFAAVIKAQTIDADGTTVLEDWRTNLGLTTPATLDFELDVTTTNVKQMADAAWRAVKDGTHGLWLPGRSEVWCICGKEAFNTFFNHPWLLDTYKATPDSRVLREQNPDEIDMFSIHWVRWDGPTTGPFGIAEDEFHFFPVGVPDAFHRVLAPNEFMDGLNGVGQDLYSIQIPDRDRNAFVRIEAYQYPAYVALMPDALITASW